ncbi:MAG TPA: hypothetical protein VFV10_09250, partial [Gammaproteobacteria bacterium]|nr:hypothetical protein [Gammaproteobacteria bacterium]
MDFRRLCDSDPNSGEPEFAAHAEQCTACARELERARRFDARLLAALRIDVPEASRDGLARAEAAPAGASPSAASAADASPSESWRADASAAGRGLPLRVKRLGLGLAASLIVAAGVGTA